MSFEKKFNVPYGFKKNLESVLSQPKVDSTISHTNLKIGGVSPIAVLFHVESFKEKSDLKMKMINYHCMKSYSYSYSRHRFGLCLASHSETAWIYFEPNQEMSAPVVLMQFYDMLPKSYYSFSTTTDANRPFSWADLRERLIVSTHRGNFVCACGVLT